ncbi:hypothetical protein DB31_1143 [Hyalangium minutum]|uniref:Uncharacterized protein n=1 Tax=Hyalangium minutum TaxID=394096 RepID=A0A085WEG5_9BACT|nr:hypothetical protein DB31_1143 [Hyalangium minutum]
MSAATPAPASIQKPPPLRGCGGRDSSAWPQCTQAEAEWGLKPWQEGQPVSDMEWLLGVRES